MAQRTDSRNPAPRGAGRGESFIPPWTFGTVVPDRDAVRAELP
ncbi:MAG: hypothetical protein AVDCRST_MAG39-738 [uncultured Sphingomonadaceae bacterium]|uniref:Uncharacterized protein n=1 Tax=uncultured Sphingomonadaceae bacterium TaxID=169976 RepID=A0A6J4SBQ2_9SPHN|nr:MAG: hypothetical protein AVDCRST_MAG39-738 [uncultured Sphingomonadaceae bacterium]